MPSRNVRRLSSPLGDDMGQHAVEAESPTPQCGHGKEREQGPGHACVVERAVLLFRERLQIGAGAENHDAAHGGMAANAAAPYSGATPK